MAFMENKNFYFVYKVSDGSLSISGNHNPRLKLASIDDLFKDERVKEDGKRAYMIVKQGVYTFSTDARGSNWIIC